jgi:hypothetical protein
MPSYKGGAGERWQKIVQLRSFLSGQWQDALAWAIGLLLIVEFAIDPVQKYPGGG